jgi:hypothetical protein
MRCHQVLRRRALRMIRWLEGLQRMDGAGQSPALGSDVVGAFRFAYGNVQKDCPVGSSIIV